MNDNSAPEYGRLLKRSTVREEIVLKADHKLDITRCRSCYEHSRSSRICKSSVARPNLYSLRETQKNTPTSMTENFQGVASIICHSAELRPTTVQNISCRSETKPREIACKSSLSVQSPNVLGVMPRQNSSRSNASLPYIRCPSAKPIKIPSAMGIMENYKQQVVSQGQSNHSVPSVIGIRRQISQCTIDANNLQALTKGGRQITSRASMRPSTVPKPSNVFPSRGSPNLLLQGKRKVKNGSEISMKTNNAEGKGKPAEVCRPSTAKSVLSVHNLEMCQPTPPDPSFVRPESRHRPKQLHSRFGSKARETPVRNTHPPYPSKQPTSSFQSTAHEHP